MSSCNELIDIKAVFIFLQVELKEEDERKAKYPDPGHKPIG